MPDDQVAEAIRNGICKVNYATELRQVSHLYRGFMGYGREPRQLRPKPPKFPAWGEIYKVVTSHMDNLGSTNKA